MSHEDPEHDGDAKNSERSDSLLAQVLRNSVLSTQWTITTLTSKARSALAVGAIVLSIVISGIVGFAGMMGNNEGIFLGSGALQPGMGYVVIAYGLACLVLVSISIFMSVKALKVVRAVNPVNYNAFTTHGDGVGEIDEDVLEEWAGMPKKDMYKKIHVAYIREIKRLEENNVSMERYTHRGQMCLIGGLFAGVGSAVVVMIMPIISALG